MKKKRRVLKAASRKAAYRKAACREKEEEIVVQEKSPAREFMDILAVFFGDERYCKNARYDDTKFTLQCSNIHIHFTGHSNTRKNFVTILYQWI